ncbi:MAG: ComF family protein [Clostridia bacterium]|nr:ComF family protein [Clostridia bacterium]MBQ8236469.1 ComF family protein [Clostridia bacterium]
MSLLDLLFPPKCPACKMRKAKEQVLCRSCLSEYEKEKNRLCPSCQNKRSRCHCRPRQATSAVFAYLSVFRYRENTPGGRLILKIKDQKQEQITGFLAKDLCKTLQNGCILKSDALITYVPRAQRSVLESGTDQARALALALGKQCTLPVIDCLVHDKDEGEQKHLSAKERHAHAQSVYHLREDCGNLGGKQVILVDDIVTSGATLSACAELLRKGGAGQIICLCAGRR